MKLLMQPLTSIHVRTEALLLTKVEVWWYLIVQLGPNLSSNFDQVRDRLHLSPPALHCDECMFSVMTPLICVCVLSPAGVRASAPGDHWTRFAVRSKHSVSGRCSERSRDSQHPTIRLAESLSRKFPLEEQLLQVFFDVCRQRQLQHVGQHAPDVPELQHASSCQLLLHSAAGPGDAAALLPGARGRRCRS